VVTFTFGFRFLFGGADITVVEAALAFRRLTPPDLDWNGDAFRDTLSDDAL
jgi:hypothetical protein